MTGIYSRLYKYKQSESLSPLENFLTEGLADLLERFSPSLLRQFLLDMLPATHRIIGETAIPEEAALAVQTQTSVLVDGASKRPDMIVLLDGKPLIVVEVKVGAAEQQHRVGAVTPDAEVVYQGQLKTYEGWIGTQAKAGWPGALLFLTHSSAPPEGFDSPTAAGQVIRSVRRWRDVAAWIKVNVLGGEADETAQTLAEDYLAFLEEQSLMTAYMTFQDLAATQLFLPSFKPLEFTVGAIGNGLLAKFPKIRDGRIHKGLYSQLGLYWFWCYFNKSTHPKTSHFYLAIGICFPGTGVESFDFEDSHLYKEPFFFVLYGDDWHKMKVSEQVGTIPSGWTERAGGIEIVSIKPISQFSPDPDNRVVEITGWAEERIGDLVARIPGYQAAPVDSAPAEEEA